MEISVTKVAAENKDTFTLHHLTDLHMDDTDHAADVLEKRVREIERDPKALWVGGGDYGSLILPNDPRYSTSRFDAHHRIPDKYVESLSELFSRIKDKCLGVGTGNHEWTIGKHYHRGVVPEVCAALGMGDKYLGARGWCVVNFTHGTKRQTLKIFQYHGWSAGRLRGRKALQAERDLGAWNADIFLLGHDHVPYADVWYTEECIGGKGGYHLRQRPRAVMNGGSCSYGDRPEQGDVKKKWKPSEYPNDSWVEGKNFRPQPPVSPTLKVSLAFDPVAQFSLTTQMEAPHF